MDEMMRRARSWNIDGIKPDIREAAREAARRQGLSISEWLNDIILLHASELGINVDDMDSDDRLEAVAARLHQLDRHDTRPPRARTPSREHDEDDESLTSRFAPRARHFNDRQANGREGFGRQGLGRQDMGRQERWTERTFDKPHGQMRIQDAEALLDAAVEAFELSAAKSQRQTAQSVDAVAKLIKAHRRERDGSLELLSDISNRLSDIEVQMARQPGDAARSQGNDFGASAVARRLEELEARLSRRPPEESFNPVKSALAQLDKRLDALSQIPVPSPQVDADLKRLESKLNALLRSSSLSSAEGGFERSAAKTAWRDSLETAVTEIGRRQRHLDGERPEHRAVPRGAEASTGPRFEAAGGAGTARAADLRPLQRDIAALGAKLEEMRPQDLATDLKRMRTEIGTLSAGLADLAPRASVTAIESAIRNLTTQIQSSREEGMREILLKPLAELANDLRHSLETNSPAQSIDALERQIKTIADKLESIDQLPHNPSAIACILEKTQDIHHLLTKAAAQPLPIEQIEKKVTALAEQIDRQSVLGPLPPDEEFSPQLQQIHIDSLAKIEDRLDDLFQKVDKAMAPDSALSAAVDPEALESAVRLLADKLAAAQNPKAEQAAFEALQSQIAELAQRLERSDNGLSTLKSLQTSVSELFTHLDETRFAANEAAQTAARNAAREAIRELTAQPGLSLGHLPDDSEITREIAGLRSVQDEADRRTHSTLNAVHETLEKIVDRLAMLEEEIAETQAVSTSARIAEQNAIFERYRESGGSFSQAAPAPVKMPESAPRQRGQLPPDDVSDLRAPANPPADFLIEPGTLFPKNKEMSPREIEVQPGERASGGSISGPARSRSDFIAAARRAAQAAQADQQDTSRSKLPIADANNKAANGRLIDQTRDFFLNHKRQLTLSIAALFLVAGAYAVVKTMGHASVDLSLLDRPGAAGRTVMDSRYDQKADTRAATNDAGRAQLQPTPNDKSVSQASLLSDPSAAMSNGAPPQRNLPMMAVAGANKPQSPIAGSDPIVTGSITAQKNTAVPAAEAPAAALALQWQAESGNAAAQYELATRYAEGRLVPRDFKLAADWYVKAALHGLAPAQYRLGSLYEKGLGVNRDLASAKSWYEKAADQGHSHAMHNLAVLIAEGGDGKPDYAMAAIWFRKAAELGIRDSQYNLAILYARGLGVQQDLVQSYIWFSIAAAQGDEDAGKKRDDVAAKLDVKSLEQAKAAVEAFKPREPDRAANEVQVPPGGWEAAVPPLPKGTKAKISQL